MPKYLRIFQNRLFAGVNYDFSRNEFVVRYIEVARRGGDVEPFGDVFGSRASFFRLSDYAELFGVFDRHYPCVAAAQVESSAFAGGLGQHPALCVHVVFKMLAAVCAACGGRFDDDIFPAVRVCVGYILLRVILNVRRGKVYFAVSDFYVAFGRCHAGIFIIADAVCLYRYSARLKALTICLFVRAFGCRRTSIVSR